MVYVILGETASGKTDVALKICKQANLPLISSDAYSIYEGFDIGSSKPSKEELEGVEHYFISSRKFGDEMTVFDFQKEGRKLLNQFQKEGRDVIVAGGTFLYTRALLFPYSFTEYKTDFHLKDMSSTEAKEKLLSLDKDAGNYVDLNNPRRVVTALHSLLNGKSLKELKSEFVNYPLYPCVFIRIQTDVDTLNQKIEKRVYQMVDQGLFEEADSLIQLDPIFASHFKGIGFKEIYEGEHQGKSKGEVVQEIITDTKKYAKRQRTFLRHQFPLIINIPKEKIVQEVLLDIRRRQMNKNKELLDLPLIPRAAIEYIPWIDYLYEVGYRQIAVYSLDKGLLDDFAYKIHLKSPLMQILFFDKDDFESPKLPKMSFVLPYLETIRHDEDFDAFVEKNHITKVLPENISKFTNAKR